MHISMKGEYLSALSRIEDSSLPILQALRPYGLHAPHGLQELPPDGIKFFLKQQQKALEDNKDTEQAGVVMSAIQVLAWLYNMVLHLFTLTPSQSPFSKAASWLHVCMCWALLLMLSSTAVSPQDWVWKTSPSSQLNLSEVCAVATTYPGWFPHLGKFSSLSEKYEDWISGMTEAYCGTGGWCNHCSATIDTGGLDSVKQELLQMQLAAREEGFVHPKLHELVKIVAQWMRECRRNRQEKVSYRYGNIELYISIQI